MSFLSPLFLAGAIAAAVPIVLHLLKRHTEQRVRFAAVALLKGAAVEHTSSRRLRELLLLALRVAALAMLALAFARPFFSGGSAMSGGLTVVAVDTSLSMSAPATVARARQLFIDAVRQAPAGDDVAVLTFADRADVVVRPTANRNEALAAIANVAPGFGATSFSAALAASAELLHGRRGTIAVVTDLQASGWDAGQRASIPESVRIEVKDVGLADNLAVESVRADGDRVVATVRNTAARPRDAHARLAIDGRAAGDSIVNITGRGTADVVFPSTALRTGAGVRAAGVAAATVDDPVGIPGDNTRYAMLGADAPAAVLVVTTSGDLDKDAWYVRHALTGVRGASTGELATFKDDVLRRYGAVVLLSTHGLERRARQRLAAYVTGGGGLLMAAGPDVDGDVVADVLGAADRLQITADPERVGLQNERVGLQNERVGLQDARSRSEAMSLAPADVRHPIFRAFGADAASLGLVQFRTVARVTGRTCQSIARFTSGETAVLDCAAGSGRAIVIASDLNNRWNDFPVRASFVPFLDQAARYLSSHGRRGVEFLVGDVPPGVKPAPGVTTIDNGAGERRVIVNVDPRESAGDRMSLDEFQSAIARLKDDGVKAQRMDAAVQESRQHLWTLLLVAMMLALVAESIVAARIV